MAIYIGALVHTTSSFSPLTLAMRYIVWCSSPCVDLNKYRIHFCYLLSFEVPTYLFDLQAAIYKLVWNPIVPNVFMTCSADWSVKLWLKVRKIRGGGGGELKFLKRKLLLHSLSHHIINYSIGQRDSSMFLAGCTRPGSRLRVVSSQPFCSGVLKVYRSNYDLCLCISS